jgi:hypothetical protein
VLGPASADPIVALIFRGSTTEDARGLVGLEGRDLGAGVVGRDFGAGVARAKEAAVGAANEKAEDRGAAEDGGRENPASVGAGPVEQYQQE